MTWQVDLERLARERPYFDGRNVPSALPGFVLWLDVMGTKNAMRASLRRALNFVMKLHAAVLEERSVHGAHVFPMNDGVFIIHRDWAAASGTAHRVLRRLAITYGLESDPRHRFMLRGAVSHGPLLFGSVITGENRKLLSPYARDFGKRIVLGAPLADAVEAERGAPPFGIAVHESAALRGVAVERGYWPWFKDPPIETCILEGLVHNAQDSLAGCPYPAASTHLKLLEDMLTT